MKQVISILLIIVISNAISQTLYEQCYSTWGKDQLGTRKNTIFSAGYLKFSVAMMLHTYGVQPMEQKFLENCGYASGDQFVWTSIDKLGFNYQGKFTTAQSKMI